ncbi:hypothetical protein RCL_jg19815.t1 [Rhizophagus clarus]|uniref:Uncharacterized protein n=1 Tax=Rhizophagus clarus TaxID=94130 RepID=A0A8H3QL87_9GLOM|nr:hypothetical protein RCL_jg19815.t1 [Rhizophagus clarus]
MTIVQRKITIEYVFYNFLPSIIHSEVTKFLFKITFLDHHSKIETIYTTTNSSLGYADDADQVSLSHEFKVFCHSISRFGFAYKNVF